MNSIFELSKRSLLIILDGFGIRDESLKNAISAANTPTLKYLFDNFPFTTINASGEYVGLPKGVMGNSEVGHMNLGAGRPVQQDLVRINAAIKNDSLKDMPKLQELIQNALNTTKRIHLVGLLSDAGVHSHIDHIKSLIKTISKNNEIKIFFHALMDGRDTSKTSGITYVDDLLSTKGFILASMQGRYFGMDRDRRWDRVEKGYKCLIGEGNFTDSSPHDYIKNQYSNEIFDEFIEPVMFDKQSSINNDDSIFFINFRPDRAREMSLAFTDRNFNEFKTSVTPSYYLCMTPYDEHIKAPILFDKERIQGGLSEYLSKLGKKQFRIAETEKYAHVTYFFNGGQEEPFPNDDRILIPSPKEVATYDLKPEMSANEITENLLTKLEDNSITFYLVNFANGDMVGHTGNFEAAIKAIETIDKCVKKLVDKCKDQDIAILLTADHGNSDQMIYEDGSPHTAHTTSKVPVSLIHPKLKNKQLNINNSDLALKDIAPTILQILGINSPKEFEGVSIFN